MHSRDTRIVPYSHAAALACGAAAALGGLAYLNALHNPFVYDDYHTVVENPSIARLTDLRAIVLHDVTRPLVNLSYAIDRALSGAHPIGFHATSVLLHMLNVGLLFAFARRILGRADAGPRVTLAAFASAALFAVHPMMTEAVGYISGRSEVLCAAYFLLAVMAGGRWLDERGVRWPAITLLLWAAAIASKELGAMFPFVLLAYDRLVLEATPAERRRRWRAVHLPLIGTALAAGLLRIAILTRIEYPGAAAVHWSYALIAADVVRRYVGLMIYPSGQSLFHEVARIDGLLAWRAWLAALAAGVMLAAVWRLRIAHGIASFGVAWFLLLLLPGAALTMLDQGEPMAEHRVYAAGCGLFLAAGYASARLDGWAMRAGGWTRPLVPVLLLLLIASFGADTVVRNAVWGSPVRLWRESVDLAPTHYRPRLLLGEALQDANREAEAAEEYRTAIRLRPAEVTGYLKLGALLAAMGHPADAHQQFDAALAIDPRNVSARQALAILDKASARTEPHDGRP